MRLDLEKYIETIKVATRERWTRERLMLETGLDRFDLTVLLDRMHREGWSIVKGWTPFQYELGDPWRLRGDFMVVGDVHVPFTDWWFSGRVALIAKRMLPRPRRLIIAGDFYNYDLFSHYEQVVPGPTWRQEREAGRYILRDWLQTFDEIWMLMGNHDRRIQKATAGAFDEDDILALLTSNQRVKMSKYGWCEVESGEKRWRVTHQKNYSINQLVVAEQLSLKHGCNVITHHEHHTAQGVDRYGQNILVNNGSLIDVRKVAYMALDDSKSAVSKMGFTVLRNGYPTLFGEHFTDWDMWLRLPEIE